MSDFTIQVADESHIKYVDEILKTIEDAAKVRGTGISKRNPEYVKQKMREGKAIIAMNGDVFAGFCYIESWGHDKFVANSGLIVKSEYRGQGLAKRIKHKAFELSRSRWPNAKIFGLTSGQAVMNINTELGYRPVTFAELTDDPEFWKGCQGCINYDVLERNNFVRCICTGMLFDPEKSKEKEKVVLAYSGGLDTSFCLKYLSEEKGLEVHTAIANTGGFSREQLADIEKKAYELGAKTHTTLDVTDRYYDACIRYMVYGNILRNNTYPISVSSERMFQAMAIIKHAKKLGAQHIAHGSTGAGNDQVRFDLTFQIMAPEIDIITPTRDLKLSRQYEIDYLKKHGVERDWAKMEYSINKGLWGTSVGGKETLTTRETLPEEAYPSHVTAIEPSRLVKLTFEKGEISAIDGKVFANKVEAIQTLEAIASQYAVGRGMHLGDTIIGIKGRVGFEAAAPMILLQSHHTLEKYTLTKWQTYWKDQVAQWYGMLLHEAQYLEPVMRDIEAMLEKSQRNVSGDVFVRLYPYRFVVEGANSSHDLMNSGFADYGEENKAFTADDVKGFTRIMGNPLKIYNKVNPGEMADL